MNPRAKRNIKNNSPLKEFIGDVASIPGKAIDAYVGSIADNMPANMMATGKRRKMIADAESKVAKSKTDNKLREIAMKRLEENKMNAKKKRARKMNRMDEADRNINNKRMNKEDNSMMAEADKIDRMRKRKEMKNKEYEEMYK